MTGTAGDPGILGTEGADCVGCTFRLALNQSTGCHQPHDWESGTAGIPQIPGTEGDQREAGLGCVGCTFRLALNQSTGCHEPLDWDGKDSTDSTDRGCPEGGWTRLWLPAAGTTRILWIQVSQRTYQSSRRLNLNQAVGHSVIAEGRYQEW